MKGAWFSFLWEKYTRVLTGRPVKDWVEAHIDPFSKVRNTYRPVLKIPIIAGCFVDKIWTHRNKLAHANNIMKEEQMAKLVWKGAKLIANIQDCPELREGHGPLYGRIDLSRT